MTAKNFLIVELQQGSSKWLEWRHNGIGASDAPTVMGENPFKSYSQLLHEKRSPKKESFKNAAMIRGTTLEPEARKRYIAKKGIHVTPICLQSIRHDWLRASLDGLTLTHDAAVEIKCGQSVYRKVALTRTAPRYYYGQLQHIMAVTNFKELDFFCYWPGYPELLVSVKRNEEYIKRLLDAEYKFWELVNENA